MVEPALTALLNCFTDNLIETLDRLLHHSNAPGETRNSCKSLLAAGNQQRALQVAIDAFEENGSHETMVYFPEGVIDQVVMPGVARRMGWSVAQEIHEEAPEWTPVPPPMPVPKDNHATLPVDTAASTERSVSIVEFVHTTKTPATPSPGPQQAARQAHTPQSLPDEEKIPSPVKTPAAPPKRRQTDGGYNVNENDNQDRRKRTRTEGNSKEEGAAAAAGMAEQNHNKNDDGDNDNESDAVRKSKLLTARLEALVNGSGSRGTVPYTDMLIGNTTLSGILQSSDTTQ